MVALTICRSGFALPPPHGYFTRHPSRARHGHPSGERHPSTIHQRVSGDRVLADIFHEVDEEVRRERLKKLWDRYGNHILALAFLVVAGIGGWRGYEYWQDQQAAKAGAAFEDAVALVEAGKHREAADMFARIATDAPGGYRVLSRMREATETGMQDAKAAVAAFDAVAADTSVRPVLRDMAALRAAFLLLDTAPYSEIQARLAPRAAAGQAVRHSARELLALSAWRANDSGASRRWAEMIVNDGETPASIRARIEILLAVLPPQAKG